MRPIDANKLFDFLTEQLNKETGAYKKGRNAGLNIARSALHDETITPTIAQPPNDPLTMDEMREMELEYADMKDKRDTLMRRWEGMVETIRKKVDAGTLTSEDRQLLDDLNLPHRYDRRTGAAQDSLQGIALLTLEELRKIVRQLEFCGYECEGGPLSMNIAFIRLKELAYRRKPEEV